MPGVQELLAKMVELNASDLHLAAGAPPLVRREGRLQPMTSELLQSEDCTKLAYSVMNELQRKDFERSREVDFSFGIANLGRFRANVFQQRGSASATFRFIPYRVRTTAELGLPKVAEDVVAKPSGLVLVTGATGSGKSTTLAGMIDAINSSREGHILTIEDPIEFVHSHKKCLVSQREIRSDTDGFASALRMALRQDPDYVLIGEMRDTETMAAALTIAETGHLTFATLHTNSAVQSVNRILDSFPDGERAQVRTQLSFVLQAVISQLLVPGVGGGRVLATEVMTATPAVRALIRDGKVHQIQGMIESGSKYGMHTINASLAELVRSRRIERSEALARTSDREGLSRLLAGNVR